MGYMTVKGKPNKFIGKYPQKVVGYQPGPNGWVMTKDSRLHKPGVSPLRKAKTK